MILDAESYDKLEEPEDDENDMLDLAFGLSDTYVPRLSGSDRLCRAGADQWISHDHGGQISTGLSSKADQRCGRDGSHPTLGHPEYVSPRHNPLSPYVSC